MKYWLYYKFPDGGIRRSPMPITARNQEEAEREGRSISQMGGEVTKEMLPNAELFELVGTADFAVELANALRGVPVFDRAEPVDGGKSLRKGLCSHNVAAKYCKICK